jgi:hypothetical protein
MNDSACLTTPAAAAAAATESSASNASTHQDSATAYVAATITAATAGAAAAGSAFSSLNIGSVAALTEGGFPTRSSNTLAGSAEKSDQKIDVTNSALANEDDYVDPDRRTSGVSAPTIQVYVQTMINKELLEGKGQHFTLTFDSKPSMLDIVNTWKTKAVKCPNPKFRDVDFRLPKVCLTMQTS